jgi:hypothetical protein
MGEKILSDILVHYRFPEATFIGSQERVRALRDALERAGKRDAGAGVPLAPR